MLRGLRKKALMLLLGSEPPNPSYDQVLAEVKDFEVALQAMDYLLDDRSEDGVKLLKEKASKTVPGKPQAILPLALGVMEFIEATLGFEADVMNKAHATLSDAETELFNNQKYNTKLKLATSHIYPPGTEFQVTYAELTLLNALVMLLRENNGMVEQAKALLKLRRAYHALDAIYRKIQELEPTFKRNVAKYSTVAGSTDSISTVDLPGFESTSIGPGSGEDLKLMKALEEVYHMRRRRIDGIVPEKADLFQLTSDLTLGSDLQPPNSGLGASTTANGLGLSTPARTPARIPSPASFAVKKLAGLASCSPNGSDDDDEFSDAKSVAAESVISGALLVRVSLVSTIDEFIHLGVQLCFGILQVVLSLIPPAIGRVLSIVGFKGDRDVGLSMLWRTAITLRNIHGELALLVILVFYDGPVQFVDLAYQLPGNEDENVKDVIVLEGKTTVTDAELQQILKNPLLYTPQLTQRARRHFPNNALWLLQECRQQAALGDVAGAVDAMQRFTDDPSTEIRMQQIRALLVFDRAMYYAFSHENEKAATDFILLIDLNSWSKGLYLFMAGCCYHLQMCILKMEGAAETEVKRFADLAEKYMKLAPTYVPGHASNVKNRKGGIGGANKQMPFDKFLLRKLGHIEQREKKTGKPFVECIGTLPILELVYFWNGFNRMSKEHLQLSLKLLGYLGEPGTPYALETKFSDLEESSDEAMIRYFLTLVTLRSLGKVDEGAQILDKHVLAKYCDFTGLAPKFTKMTYLPYLYPTALYERLMFNWLSEINLPGAVPSKVADECKEWLKRAETVGEGDYELSNRTGMRIKAAADRVEVLGAT